jgi:hypothetical protein
MLQLGNSSAQRHFGFSADLTSVVSAVRPELLSHQPLFK